MNLQEEWNAYAVSIDEEKGVMKYHNLKAVFNWFEEKIKERDEEIIKELESEKTKLKGTSIHGNCCTCSECRNYHDECTCNFIGFFNQAIEIITNKKL